MRIQYLSVSTSINRCRNSAHTRTCPVIATDPYSHCAHNPMMRTRCLSLSQWCFHVEIWKWWLFSPSSTWKFSNKNDALKFKACFPKDPGKRGTVFYIHQWHGKSISPWLLSLCSSVHWKTPVNIAGWKMDPYWRCICYWKWGYSSQLR